MPDRRAPAPRAAHGVRCTPMLGWSARSGEGGRRPGASPRAGERPSRPGGGAAERSPAVRPDAGRRARRRASRQARRARQRGVHAYWKLTQPLPATRVGSRGRGLAADQRIIVSARCDAFFALREERRFGAAGSRRAPSRAVPGRAGATSAVAVRDAPVEPRQVSKRFVRNSPHGFIAPPACHADG